MKLLKESCSHKNRYHYGTVKMTESLLYTYYETQF
jgi:hypothetical protein